MLRSLAGLALLAASATQVSAQTIARNRIDTTFAFGRGGWLDVSSLSGNVVVTGWTRPEARVIARIERGTIEASLSDSRITLSPRPERNSRSRNRIGEAYFEVSVPVGTRVMVTATAGDVRIRGTAAEVQATTAAGNIEVIDATDRIEIQSIAGDIRLERATGRVRIMTTSGDMTLSDIKGAIDIRAVSSDMELRRVESSDVRLGTTTGDLTYEGTVDPRGTYEFNTHSGDVRFAMPEGGSATLSLSTFNGDIQSAFPMLLQPGENIAQRRGRRMEFAVGSGGARVTISTFSGDIIIERGYARSPRE